MTTRIDNTVTINQPAQKVIEAFGSADYWTYIAQNLSPEPGELNEFKEAEKTAVLFEVLPPEFLPEAARAMITQSLKVKRVVTVKEQGEDSTTLTYDADVKGTPASFGGEITLKAEGENTVLNYDNEVTVDIPFMGGAIEGKVGEYLDQLFGNEAALTDKWIAENL